MTIEENAEQEESKKACKPLLCRSVFAYSLVITPTLEWPLTFTNIAVIPAMPIRL